MSGYKLWKGKKKRAQTVHLLKHKQTKTQLLPAVAETVLVIMCAEHNPFGCDELSYFVSFGTKYVHLLDAGNIMEVV